MLALVYYGATYCILCPEMCKYYSEYYFLKTRRFSIEEERAFLHQAPKEATDYFHKYHFNGSDCHFKILGFVRFDEHGIWSTGNKALLSFMLSQVYASVSLNFDVAPYVNSQNKNLSVEIYLDDRKIDEWTFRYGHKIPQTKIKIAQKYLSSQHPINLIFKIDGASSPKELGFGEENLPLGFALNSLTIIPDN